MYKAKYSFFLKLVLSFAFVYSLLLFIRIFQFKIDDSERDPKTILMFIPFFGIPDYNFGIGKQPFIDHKCPVTNCYITNDINHLSSVDKFDAVLFHGAEYRSRSKNQPEIRDPSQIYIYMSMESPISAPAEISLNGFFNMTMTYRIDSDVIFSYIYITDMSSNVISPSLNPTWRNPDVDERFLKQYRLMHEKKSKPVAWFSSNCETTCKREIKINDLQKYIDVDIYGKCGPLECPRTNDSVCFEMLRNDYYFYLSYENSLCVDYVTEKASNPLYYNAIPIVYGGADYSRFFPPHSYIDSTKYSPSELADLLKHLINNPEEYVKYFWWRKYYKQNFEIHPFCKLCQMLNENNWKPKSYNMREWWHGTDQNPICTTVD